MPSTPYLSDQEVLAAFLEESPDFRSAGAIARWEVEKFVDTFADAIDGGRAEARRIYEAAFAVSQRTALIWANIKDTVASPYMKDTLFNNIPHSFIAKQEALPNYAKLFGALTLNECDHCKSIFGPAAYFVDLMRFIEETITPKQKDVQLRLENRQPSLFHIDLDCDNTYSLIPFIDIVNEILEAVVRDPLMPDAYEKAAQATYPMDLPFNLPHVQVRDYLRAMGTHLYEVYEAFELVTNPVAGKNPEAGPLSREGQIGREILNLSPLDYELISKAHTSQKKILGYFGTTQAEGLAKLSDVETFLERTGLTRTQLTELIYQDLSAQEFNAGLSRAFFINNAGNNLPPVSVEIDHSDPDNLVEKLHNLSFPRLDAIYRFLMLARKLGWSFADLEWALRSTQPDRDVERVLKFDGINDYVACSVKRGLAKATVGDQITIEGWVQPEGDGNQVILCSGNAANNQALLVVMIDYAGRICLLSPENSKSQTKEENILISGYHSIPRGEFTHIAVTLDRSLREVSFYINGKLDTTKKPIAAYHFPTDGKMFDTDISLGRNFNDHYFEGIIKEVRIWKGIRTPQEISANRYTRFSGTEPGLNNNLLGYWPLSPTNWNNLPDLSKNRNDGIPGGSEFITQPRWVERDLVLDPLPAGPSPGTPPTSEVLDNPDWTFWNENRLALIDFETRDIVRNDPRLRRGFEVLTSRTVQVWFKVKDKYLSHEKQVIYHEGETEGGLILYLHAGYLYFGAYSDSDSDAAPWEKTFLRTPQVTSGQWHHAAIVLDASAVVQDEALRAYVDGRLVDTGPATQLEKYNGKVELGGVSNGARFHDGKYVASETSDVESHTFKGMILDFHLWGKTFTGEEIQKNRFSKPLTGAEAGLLIWSGNWSKISPSKVAKIKSSVQQPVVLNRKTLEILSGIERLRAKYDLSVDKLCALWYAVKHTGKADGEVLFDTVFNPLKKDYEYWDYYADKPILWDRSGETNPKKDRVTQSRLRGSLRLSQKDLQVLMDGLIGGQQTVSLTNDMLSQMYRLSQFAKVLKLKMEDFMALLDVMQMEDVRQVEDFVQISKRADWLKLTGLKVYELDFIIFDTPHEKIRVIWSEAALRGLADDLLKQARDFLAAENSFIMEGIDEGRSGELFNTLVQGKFIALQVADRGDESLEMYTVTESVANGQALNEVYDTIAWLGGNDGTPLREKITEILIRKNAEHYNACIEGLSGLFGSEPELVIVLFEFFRMGVSPTDFLMMMAEVEEMLPIAVEIEEYLEGYEKVLFIADKFALNPREVSFILDNPEWFGVNDLTSPDIQDVDNLFNFKALATNFKDKEDRLIGILASSTEEVPEEGEASLMEELADLADWELPRLVRLVTALGFEDSYNTIEHIQLLYQCFDMAEDLQSDVDFLVSLADTRGLDYAYYRNHADALLNIFHAQYEDNEAWDKVYRPVRDKLATQKRNALTSLAMLRIPESFNGRRSPDLLTEFLLIDVQMGSETDTSRIVQATLSAQLYVQRCLMNLEANIFPEIIPEKQWGWMKNYRVWEANRKVFLYPENYIEPELRDTKSPLFQDLEDQLMQGDVNDDTVAQAYTNYLENFVQLSNLKIVGSYLQVDSPPIPFTYGLDFNTISNQVQIGNSTAASSLVTKDFTVTAWVFMKSLPSNGGIIGCLKNQYYDIQTDYSWDFVRRRLIVTRKIIYNEEKGWLLGTTQGRFSIALSTVGGNQSGRNGVLTYLKAPASVSKTNTWVHLAATYNGTTLILYVDGIQVASTHAQSGNILYPNSADFMIGRYKDRYNNTQLDGHIHDLRIFNKALTQPNILRIREGYLPALASVTILPVAWWKMNEGQGTSILDHSEGNRPLAKPGNVNWVKVKDQAAALRQAKDVTEKEKTLYLIGRTETEPHILYYRKNEVGKKWYPWQRIDLSIKSEYVAPVYAFGRLFLFWAEIKESTKSRETKNKDKNGNFITENVTVFTPIIKYSYLNFANSWVQEQTYAQLKDDISEFETQLLKWQRIYVQQSLEFEATLPEVTKTRVPVIPEKISVLRMGADSASYLMNPLVSGEALDSFSVSCWLLWNKPEKSEEKTNAEKAVQDAKDRILVLDREVNSALTERDRVNGILLGIQSQLKVEREGRTAKQSELNLETDTAKKAVIQAAINSLSSVITNLEGQERTAITDLNTAQSALDKKNAELATARTTLDTAEQNLQDIITREENTLKSQVIFQYGGGEMQLRSPENLTLHFNDTEEATGIAMTDGVWNHFHLNIEYKTDKYSVEILKDGVSVATKEVSSATQLSPGLTVEIGSESKYENDSTRFEGQITELVIWTDKMAADLVKEQMKIRATLEQQQILLGYAALTEAEKKGLEKYEEVDGTVLELANAPVRKIVEPKERERILLFYGNVVRSLRSNLKEYSFKLNLQPNANPVNSYDVNIWQSKLYLEDNAPLGLLDYSGDSGELLDLADQASSNLTAAITNYQKWMQSHSPIRLRLGLGIVYTIDLFQHQRVAVHGKFITDLVRISAMMNLLKQQYSNSNDETKVFVRNLPNAEAQFTDVNNQPGWYVLDTGDEQFLMKKKEIAFYPLKTVSERLLFNYEDINPNSSTETQDMSIILEEDPALTTPIDPNPTFTLERLNTNILYDLSESLFKDGIDGLLSIESQQLRELDFGRFAPNKQLLPDEVSVELGFEGATGLYFREVFFHIPFYIANQLNSNQKFEEAQKWYHYIFNPTARESDSEGLENPNDRYWRYLPFRQQAMKSFEEILTNEEALAEYHNDPFDPHAIARLRINAYQKAIVMKYIDNLLDWGDSLFRQDSRESINEATLLYILAYNILGPRPKPLIQEKSVVTGTYATLRKEQEMRKTQVKHVPEFLTPETIRGGASPYTPNHHMEYSFCIPENENFVGYWDRVEDRLFKVRHSLNIDGIFRTLALFQPPIDPMALVRAAAGGRDIGSVLSGFNVSVPHYRYSYMLDKARSITSTLQGLGGALLDALEKKDAEHLSLLQNTQERAILDLTTSIKQNERDAARASLDGLRISLDGAKFNKQHYEDLISNGLSGLELTQLIMEGVSQGLKLGATITTAVAAAGAAIPNFTAGGAGAFGSPVATVTTGGGSVSTAAEKIAKGMEIGADIASAVGSITGTLAGYERRENEWKFERDKSDHEIKNLQTQIEAAEFSLKNANQEMLIHQRTIEHNKQVEDFMKSKFSNKELYNWMVTRISGLYFQTYKIAYDMAKLAEKALQYEFGVDTSYINFGHWDSLKKGLLAGESLELDLNRMEKAAIDMDSRYLEIEKVISLRQLNPVALAELKNKGECEFEFSEKMFDMDYPGHYFRVIKAVTITIPVVVGPYQTVKATLTQLRSHTLLSPDEAGLQFLLGDSDEPSSAIRTNWRAYQSIAISKGVNDSGLFELSFSDDRYLPFEGTGAVSKWKLSMPKASNHFDFDTLSDVIINLRYTSAMDVGFRDTVIAQEAMQEYTASSIFSLAQENPAGWNQFIQSGTPHRLSFNFSPQAFPPNFEVEIDKVYLLAEGEIKQMAAFAFELFLDDDHAQSFGVPVPGEPPVELELTIEPSQVLTLETEDNLEGLENLVLMVSYKSVKKLPW